MMTIKVNLKDDHIITRINGSLEDIAKYYFPRKEVESIEILEGGISENEYFRQIPLEIYRVSKEEIEEFQLHYNIRYRYKMEYKQGQAKDYISSSGLYRVA